MKNFRFEIKSSLLLLAIISVVWIADISLVIWYHGKVYRFLESQPIFTHADAGIVFFGDFDRPGNGPGPDSRLRADLASDFFRRGIVDRIVCVGGNDGPKRGRQSHPLLPYLINKGIPSKYILTDSISFNTLTNWEEALKIIRREHFHIVAAISAPLHVYRIAKVIDSPNVYYCAYDYNLTGIRDYWILYKSVHREWVSMLLSFALRDNVRNKTVQVFRLFTDRFRQVI